MLEDKKQQYDVALSFAGEDRAYVDEVARLLKESKIHVFYDDFEKVKLWGKNMVVELDRVYRLSSRYVVVFISENYAQNVWTNYELRCALSRAIEEKREFVLPARFDDTQLAGIPHTISYVDVSKVAPQVFASMLISKVTEINEPTEKITPPAIVAARTSIATSKLPPLLTTHFNLNSVLKLIASLLMLLLIIATMHALYNLTKAPHLNAELHLMIGGFRIKTTNSGNTVAKGTYVDIVSWGNHAPDATIWIKEEVRDLTPNGDYYFDIDLLKHGSATEIDGRQYRASSSGYITVSCSNCDKPRAWAFYIPGEKSSFSQINKKTTAWPIVEFAYPEDKPGFGVCVNYPKQFCEDGWFPKNLIAVPAPSTNDRGAQLVITEPSNEDSVDWSCNIQGETSYPALHHYSLVKPNNYNGVGFISGELKVSGKLVRGRVTIGDFNAGLGQRFEVRILATESQLASGSSITLPVGAKLSAPVVVKRKE